MTDRPFINVAHRVEAGGSIRLYSAVHATAFASLMAALYPRLASTVTVKRGYSAFAEDGRFIGIMTSTGLTSVRRNPLLEDDSQLFLRALLAGLHTDGLKTSSMYCDWDNYGTLRLIQKLGMGAKPSRSGHLSARATPDTLAYLGLALSGAKVPYQDHRAYAARKLASLTPTVLSGLIPVEPAQEPIASLDVTLL